MTFNTSCRSLCSWGLIGVALVGPRRLEGQTFQQLYSFCHWSDATGWDCSDGISPQASLIQGRDGSFYGTTSQGGKWGCGTVFRISVDGAYSVLASFDGTNGCSPNGALLQGAGSEFYGTTVYGGTANDGTTFRITTDGVLTSLGSFYAPASGGNPLGDLAAGMDGQLYGVAGSGLGSIFRISTNAAFAVLHWFSLSDPAGYYASGGLLLATDGNFYGVTAGLYGTVYKMTPEGTVSLVAGFPDGPNGAAWPSGKLVEAPDGSLYGAADNTLHLGAIFRVTRDGKLKTFASFNAGTGHDPRGPLALGNDGNFYGCCYDWGFPGDGSAFGAGTVFRMTPDGALTALFSFSRAYGTSYFPPGANPEAGLVQGSDGNLYGTTDDNIFRILMPGPLLTLSHSPAINKPQSTINQLVLSWRTNYANYTLQSAANPASANWLDCTNPPAVVGGQYFVTNAVSTGPLFFRLKK